MTLAAWALTAGVNSLLRFGVPETLLRSPYSRMNM